MRPRDGCCARETAIRNVLIMDRSSLGLTRLSYGRSCCFYCVQFKPLEGQSWYPLSLRARLEGSLPKRRPQTRAEVQRQIPPDHAGERRTANSSSSKPKAEIHRWSSGGPAEVVVANAIGIELPAWCGKNSRFCHRRDSTFRPKRPDRNRLPFCVQNTGQKEQPPC